MTTLPSSPSSAITVSNDIQSKAPTLNDSTQPGVHGGLISIPQLPLELRTMIWQAVLATPRILEVGVRENPGHGKFKHAIIHNNPLPALLQVCQESRALAKKKYHTRLSRHDHLSAGPRFDPAEDIIFIPLDMAGMLASGCNPLFSTYPRGRYWSAKVRASLKHIAIDWRTWSGRISDIVQFSQLETLTIVIHEGEPTLGLKRKKCPDMWSEESTEEIAFLEAGGGEVCADIERRVAKMISDQKKDGTLPLGWAPKLLIKYMTRCGEKCCTTETPFLQMRRLRQRC